MNAMTSAPRKVARIINGLKTFEGEGFPVTRPFPQPGFSYFDPFLLLDVMGPADNAPGAAKGTPVHPHRGFETVTYMLEGSFVHRDSLGSHGRLDPGDVQWMTAGRGILHEEQPSPEIHERGGRIHGIQLWVNLPARDKLAAPRYQDTPAARMPVVERDGAWVKVIAGESLGAKAVIETRIPILYLHVKLQPGIAFTQPIPAGFNAFAYVLSGEGRFGADGQTGREGQMIMFAAAGSAVSFNAAADRELSLLLLAGQPLNERVTRYGPFVMNTPDEIQQAIRDYQEGKLASAEAFAPSSQTGPG